MIPLILNNARLDYSRNALEDRVQPPDPAPLGGDYNVIDPAFNPGKGWKGSTACAAIVRPGGRIAQAVTNQRHHVVDEPGGNHLASFPGSHRRTIPQQLDYTKLRVDMIRPVLALRDKRNHLR
jgi:hypothetical protein